MLTKTACALAFALATATGALTGVLVSNLSPLIANPNSSVDSPSNSGGRAPQIPQCGSLFATPSQCHPLLAQSKGLVWPHLV
jgi:hypothetical protein